MNILGIHDGHNAAAALMVDGRIVAAVQEERLTRRKNEVGFPKRAIEEVLSLGGVRREDLDVIAVAGRGMPARVRGQDLVDAYTQRGTPMGRLKVRARESALFPLYRSLKRGGSRNVRKQQIRESALDGVRAQFYEHHLCHAAAAYWGSGLSGEAPVLLLTCDGGGDGLSGSVSIGKGRDIERMAVIRDSESLGNIYAITTFVLGMMPWEHEYKLMGMAPYAREEPGRALARDFERLLGFQSGSALVWERGRQVPPTFGLLPTLQKMLERQRFDTICAGLQFFTEDLLVEWVKRCVRETGIRRLALSGGVFMNVKANKAILDLEEVETLYVLPSCGDETNAIGACYLAHVEHEGGTPSPITDLYLGRGYSRDEVDEALRELREVPGIEVTSPHDLNEAVARRIAAGEVVARCEGRMEFGARALGNRSILANPSESKVIRVINDMIKKRDFWMPFAPSLLPEHSGKYIVNPKEFAAPYMIMAFDTREDAGDQIEAALHPYDRTCRPQEVDRAWNPDYYEIISAFHDLTGIAGVLNTSFNLHGFPIVRSPSDAIEVFRNSGLNHLVMGPYLVSKR
jgi:carbamoyltransferase